MINTEKLLTAFANLSPRDTELVVNFVEAASGMNLQTPTKTRYYTRKEIEAGQGWPCAVKGDPCQKRTRSKDRSLRHATTNAELKDFGHIAVR